MKNRIYKKLLIRLILLAAVLLGLNFVYSRWFYESDIQKHSAVINKVRAVPDTAKVVYLGESSNITFREDDLDKRPISAFIDDQFPGLEVTDITKRASHAGIYKYLLEHLPDSSEIETVILTLNLRSFNAQWIFSNLETPLQKSMVLLRNNPPLLNRFLLSFKAYDIKTDEEREEQFKEKWREDKLEFPYDFPHETVIEWDRWMANEGIKDSTGSIDQDKTVLACHFIKAYAFQLDTNNNPRIRDFNEIIKLARERNWNLVLNLLAENAEKANELVGEDLVFLMKQNRDILIEYFQESRDVPLVDNLFAIENEQFVDQDYPTEHYAEKGRKTIAKNVAKTLRQFYPKEYVELNQGNWYRTSFFNDCEGESFFWGQLQTIVEGQAFSGTHASKTGPEANYSITFKYPIKEVPDSLKNQIDCSFRVFQKNNQHEAKLVLQFFKGSEQIQWLGKKITNKINSINNWRRYSYTYQFDEETKKADVLKVYVYNPSDTEIWIDDFEIEFR